MTLELQQLSTHGVRGEKINTARTLLVAEFLAEVEGRWPLERLCEVVEVPQYNDVRRIDRAREMLRVWAYYPRPFLEFAYQYQPPWQLLVRPTAWADADPEEVVEFLRGEVERRGAWPTVDALFVRFGRQTNHPSAASKTPGQEALI